MKGKPLEPGCIAMIVGAVHHPKNNGKVVRVVRLLTEAVYSPPEIAHKLRNHRQITRGKIWIVETLDGKQDLHFLIERRHRLGYVEPLDFYVSSRAVAEIRLKRLDDGEQHTESHQLETQV